MIRFIITLALTGLTLAGIPLGVYNIDRDAISVSGISSGGAMATQMHVAYSSLFMAVGMVAGVPYYCAENRLLQGLRCMDTPGGIDPHHLAMETLDWQSRDRIDHTSNMLEDRVFIFQGQLDTAIVPGVAPTIVEYYRRFVRAENIKVQDTIDAVHGFPTRYRGSACNVIDEIYVNRCAYDGAYHILRHAYGEDIIEPHGLVPLNGHLYLFDQAEFFAISFPVQSSMDSDGYVYVPSGCNPIAHPGNKCKLHVVFHGCLQGRGEVGDRFVDQTEYNEVGELNNIIILYPQAVTTAVNPQGCWDWWGYLNFLYPTKDGNQPLAVYRMIEKMARL